MLAYLKGEKYVLVIDAGNSADHVDEFYKALDVEGLKKPDFTVITHWHWDHTFGMHRIHGLSIAHNKTNDFLENEKRKLNNDYADYVDCLKNNDKCFKAEYVNNKEVVIVNSDISFESSIELYLGGMTAKIFHTVSPHSIDTVLIYIPEEYILFLGDSTCEDFSNEGYMDKDKLKALISLIESIDCQYCILSHADPLTKADLLHYLKTL
jgi:glyoxylase-like metal-dependent hydrolase (beta-lactamase superfamily II)